MRHLAENLSVNQHCREHLYLFYVVAKAYSLDEFSKHFAELKNNCPEAAHVLENVIGFEKWSRVHLPGNKYDVMTTNITESLNSILTDEQEYPHVILRDTKSANDSLYETNVNGGLDQFTLFGNGVTTKVNLLERSCSCRKYDLVRMSCEYAMAALRAKYGDGKGYGNSIYEYSSSIYKVETYFIAYSGAINVVPPEFEWIVI
ncbi:uncharacterized protein LOC124887181 [Capsicum annuum]|uniref:uncharacterized protein LOC124887181 n=1 Tax=Capsicum annuum TaxID=4072 RepID=UPI001FB0682E|nr:uncharacterized protein LOC124887181 [Capsicum annuum]